MFLGKMPVLPKTLVTCILAEGQQIRGSSQASQLSQAFIH